MSILDSLPVGLVNLLGVLLIVLGVVFLLRNRRQLGSILLAAGVLTICAMILLVFLALRSLG